MKGGEGKSREAGKGREKVLKGGTGWESNESTLIRKGVQVKEDLRFEGQVEGQTLILRVPFILQRYAA